MIETGIEIGHLIRSSFHFDSAQITVPFVFSLLAGFFKVPSGLFGSHISFGTFHTGRRHGDLHQHLFAGLQIKGSHDSPSFFRFAHRKINSTDHRTVELESKEVILIHPYAVAHMSAQGTVVFPFHVAGLYLGMILFLIPGRTMLQVDQYGGRVSLIVSVTVQSCMQGSSQFRLYARFVERNGIITRSRTFAILLERAAIAVPCPMTVSGDRHDQNISQVHASGSVQMCLGESPDNRILVDIFRTVSPSHGSRYRTGLYHTERTAGTGESMSVIGCSDKGIDILCIVCGGCFLLRGRTTEERAAGSQCTEE